MEPKEPRPRRSPRITTEHKEEPPTEHKEEPPTEHKQEPPTEQKEEPPTEHKEEPPIRRRGRPRLTIEQKEETKRIRLANISKEEQKQQRHRHAESQRNHRANLSQEEQEQHRASQRDRLANLSHEEQEQHRATNAESQRNHRANLSQEEQEQHRTTNAASHRNRRQSIPRTFKKARASTLSQMNDNDVNYFHIGSMDQSCSHCSALYWLKELNTNGKYHKCCMGGKVVLPPMPPPPPYVKSLLLHQGNNGRIFAKRAKVFNGWLSFASISLTAFRFNGGIPAMRIQGQIYHNLGSINPPQGVQPRNMQVLFHDCSKPEPFTDAEWIIAQQIIVEIKSVNLIYQSMNLKINELRNDNIPTLNIVLGDRIPANAPTRTYNAPTATEVSAIIIGSLENGEAGNDSRSINVQLNGGGIQKLKSTSKEYDPLAYVLTHMLGTTGWTYSIPYNGGSVDNDKNITAMRFYAYRAQVHNFNMLHIRLFITIHYIHLRFENT